MLNYEDLYLQYKVFNDDFFVVLMINLKCIRIILSIYMISG